jgi:hypothetical protein
LLQTVAHEGSHVQDDLGFFLSFNFSTNKFDPDRNFAKYHTEFKAFEMGASIERLDASTVLATMPAIASTGAMLLFGHKAPVGVGLSLPNRIGG